MSIRKISSCLFLMCGFAAAPVTAHADWFSSDPEDGNPASNAYVQRYGGGNFVPLAPAPVPLAQKSAAVMPAPSGTTAATPAPMAYRQQYDASATQAPAADTDKRAELDITALYDSDPSSDVNGGSSYGIETTLYSATIDKDWRLFAGELFMHEQEPFGESNVNYSRSMAGVEYDSGDIKASLAPTFNVYDGNQRTGAAGDLTWYAADNWSLGGGAQLFSRDVPLRALASGVTANSYDANAGWYQEAVRSARFDAEALTFSDGNTRTILSAADTEHFYTSSRFTIDGLGSVVESQNSKNEDRDYFNPKQDVLGMIGARVTQPLYKNYDIAYDHSVDVKPGVYWQQDYGGSAAVTAGYSQHINYKDDIDASASVDFTRQDADGAPENDLAFLLNLSKKF